MSKVYDTGLVAELANVRDELQKAGWSNEGSGYIAVGLMLVLRLDRCAVNLQETFKLLNNRLVSR